MGGVTLQEIMDAHNSDNPGTNLSVSDAVDIYNNQR